MIIFSVCIFLHGNKVKIFLKKRIILVGYRDILWQIKFSMYLVVSILNNFVIFPVIALPMKTIEKKTPYNFINLFKILISYILIAAAKKHFMTKSECS